MAEVKDLIKRTKMLQEQLYRQGIIDGLTELKKKILEDSDVDELDEINKMIAEYSKQEKKEEVIPEEYADKGMTQDGFSALMSAMSMFSRSDNIDDSDDELESERISDDILANLPKSDVSE